jgi:hypothetical protein
MTNLWNKLVSIWNWAKSLVIEQPKPVKKKRTKKAK